MKLRKYFVRLEFKNAIEAKAFYDNTNALANILLKNFQQNLEPEEVLTNLLIGSLDQVMMVKQVGEKNMKPRLILPN